MKLRLSITLQITLVFVLFAAALLAGAGIFAYKSGHDALQAATAADLLSKANEKQAALGDWIKERLLDVAVPAALPHLLDDLTDLTTAKPDSPAARAAHDHLVRDLKPRTGPGEEFLMLFVMDPETGKVLAATDPREEGKFKEDRAYFVNGKKGPYVENPYNSLGLRGPAMTVSAPLRTAAGRLLGVLAGHVNLDAINVIIGRRTGSYQSDDAFLVNMSSLLVTQPRSMTDPAVLRRGIHMEPVRRGLAGQSGTMLADDYRGVPVIAVYRWLPEHRLCLIVKIDQAEAFAPSRAFGRTLLIFGVLTLLAAAALAVVIARIGTRPILAMQAGAARFARGELDVRLPETSRNELGALAREFNQMAAAISERETALRKWAHIFEHAGWGVVATNADGKTIGMMNPTFARMYGYTAEELTGKPVAEIFAPDARANVPEHIRIANEKGHHTFESQHVRKDRTVFPVLVDVTAAKDAQGKVLYHVANVQDITERKRAEDTLREERAFLSAVLDNIEEAIVTCDGKGRLVRFNEAARRLHGLPEQPIPPEQWAEHYDLYHADGRTPLPTEDTPLFRAQQGERVHEAEIVIAPKHDVPHFLVCNGQPLMDETGRITGTVVAMHDITKRKRTEEALRALSSRQEAILAAVPDVIVEVDNNRVYTWANQAGLEFFGKDVVGKEASFYFEGEQDIYGVVKPLFNGAENVIYVESWQRRKDGQKRLLAWWCRVLKDDSGNVTGALSTARDVTERKRAEDEIRKLNVELEQRVAARTAELAERTRQMETFTYSVSHDLKAPLRGIDGYSRLLLEDYSDRLDGEGRTFLNTIRQATDQMRQLIEDLLAYSRMERRSLALNKVHLPALVQTLLAERAEDINTRNVSVTVDMPDIVVTADPEGLAQVLRNLLDNALKFTGKVPEPHIEIGGQENEKLYVLWVRDNGIGFDMRYHDRIFEIFQRLHTAEDYPGTGIGMAIVQKAMQRMGGRVWAESTPGKGTTFYLEVPK